MIRINLLLEHYVKRRYRNYNKILVIEAFIILISIGIYQVQPLTYTLTMILIGGLTLIAISLIINQFRNHRLIHYIAENHQHNSKAVILRLQTRQRFYNRMFNLLSETFLFTELLSTLKRYELYKDEDTIGPWNLIFDLKKTKSYNQSIKKFNDIDIFKRLYTHIDKIPPVVIEKLTELGIDYRRAFDVLYVKEYEENLEFEVVYPLFGLITNDSPFLHRRFIYKYVDLTETCKIKPNETSFDGNQLIMLHIRMDVPTTNKEKASS